MKAKGNGEGGKSNCDGKKRVMAWKRAMVRAARAMATVMRAAGDNEGEGVKEGDKDEEGDGDGNVGGGWRVTKKAMAMAAGALATGNRPSEQQNVITISVHDMVRALQ